VTVKQVFEKEGEVRDAVDKIQNYNHSHRKENVFVAITLSS